MEINRFTFGQLAGLGKINKSFEDLDVNKDGKINEADKSGTPDAQIKNAIDNLLNLADSEDDTEVENFDFSFLSTNLALNSGKQTKYVGLGDLAEKSGASKNSEQVVTVNGKPLTGLKNGKYYVDGKPATGEYKGKYYVKGSLANGEYKGIFYKNGVKFTGTTKGIYYKDGIKFNGKKGSVLYKDGVKFTGVNEQDKLFYKDGKVGTGTYNNVYYQKGKPFTGIASNKYYKAGKLATGEYKGKLYIKGSIANGEYKGIFYKNGVKFTGTTKGIYYKDGIKFNGKKGSVLYKDGVKFTGVNEQDKIFYKDGKVGTGTYNNVYYQKGKPFTGIASNKYYKAGKLATGEYKGKLYIKGSIANGEYKGIFYKNGVKFTGTTKGIYYKDGIKFNGKKGSVLYKDGVKFTGTNYDDGLRYKNGTLFTGTADGVYFKKGIAYTDKKCKTKLTGTGADGIYYDKGMAIEALAVKQDGVYAKGKKIISINSNEKAVINKDGTISVHFKEKFDDNSTWESTRTYNDLGQILSQTDVSCFSDGTKIIQETQFDDNGEEKSVNHKKYSADGNLLNTSNCEYENGKRKSFNYKEYSSNGNLLNTSGYEYYTNGQIKIRDYTEYSNSGEVICSEKDEYFENGNTKSFEYEYNNNGEKISGEQRYNEQGSQTYSKYIDSDGGYIQETEFNEDGITPKKIKQTGYDKFGNKISDGETNFNDNGYDCNVSYYDANGNVTEKSFTHYDQNNGRYFSVDEKYDENGDLKTHSESETQYDEEGNPIYSRNIIYDGKKNIILEEGTEFTYDEQGCKIGQRSYCTDKLHPENSYNNEISCTYTQDGKVNTITKKFDKDGDGNFDEIHDYKDLSYLSARLVDSILATDTAVLSDRMIEDIEIVKNAEAAGLNAGPKGSAAYQKAYDASIKEQMIKTPETMKGDVGEIVQKAGKLYINDGNKLVELDISADTYLKLFPPIERYDIAQNSIGDCYFISAALVDMMKNPTAFAKVMQMFSEDSKGNITIDFAGTLGDYPVTFNKGELKELDGISKDGFEMWQREQITGAKGIQMLEQAYALARFALESSEKVSSIDIDDAIELIASGGLQNDVYGQVLGIDNKWLAKVPDEVKAYWFEMEGDRFTEDDFMENDPDKFKERILNLADAINNGTKLVSLGFYEEYPQYDIVGGHAYSIEKIDVENNMIYLTNPWHAGSITAVPLDILSQLALGLCVGDLT